MQSLHVRSGATDQPAGHNTGRPIPGKMLHERASGLKEPFSSLFSPLSQGTVDMVSLGREKGVSGVKAGEEVWGKKFGGKDW